MAITVDGTATNRVSYVRQRPEAVTRRLTDRRRPTPETDPESVCTPLTEPLAQNGECA